MPTSPRPRFGLRANFSLAGQALRMWTPRQWYVAAAVSVAVALVVGLVTVLIPNPVFGREIPPVWWNYPVWLLTSVLSGMLAATYVRPSAPASDSATNGVAADPSNDRPTGQLADRPTDPGTGTDADADPTAKRSSRMGLAGAVLAWFAVGCPVCNKLALLALGYSGAITWFAPVQPFLALAAMLLTGVALIWRLRGQVACPVRPTEVAVAR